MSDQGKSMVMSDAAASSVGGSHSKEIALAVVSAYDELVARALQAASAAPYHRYTSNDEFARIAVEDGGVVRLSWLTVESDGYNGYDASTNDITFPLALLLMSPAEFTTWQAEQQTAYHRQQAEAAKAQMEARARQTEARERQMLALLKAKYEAAQS